MTRSARWLWTIACVLGFVGVACGAFGAHGLEKVLAGQEAEARRLAIWNTACRYCLYHALATLAAVLIAPRAQPEETPPPLGAALAAGWCFVAGTLVFSGSLWALTLTWIRPLGAITPIGGLFHLVGWLCLAWAGRARALA